MLCTCSIPHKNIQLFYISLIVLNSAHQIQKTKSAHEMFILDRILMIAYEEGKNNSLVQPSSVYIT